MDRTGRTGWMGWDGMGRPGRQPQGGSVSSAPPDGVVPVAVGGLPLWHRYYS